MRYMVSTLSLLAGSGFDIMMQTSVTAWAWVAASWRSASMSMSMLSRFKLVIERAVPTPIEGLATASIAARAAGFPACWLPGHLGEN